ncbi:prepilin peptidase [Salmonella enterica subsp. enterica serovar Choleraesuis]|nr:prepilin peptidase [Salmonella enterica subsp. enterica serovar Choleraesuis]
MLDLLQGGAMEITFWLGYLGLVSTLCITDLRNGLLPDRFTLKLLWLGLLYQLVLHPVQLQDAVIGAITGYLSLWSIGWLWKLIRHRDGIGYGDYKLLAALGAWHGWLSLPGIIIIATLSGLAIACGRLCIGLPQTWSTPLRFGPMLIAGGLVTACLPILVRHLP